MIFEDIRNRDELEGEDPESKELERKIRRYIKGQKLSEDLRGFDEGEVR